MGGVSCSPFYPIFADFVSHLSSITFVVAPHHIQFYTAMTLQKKPKKKVTGNKWASDPESGSESEIESKLGSELESKEVQKLYMKIMKEGGWEGHEQRDDQQFLNMERKIYKEMFPLNDGASSGDEGTQEEEDFEDVSVGGESVQFLR